MGVPNASLERQRELFARLDNERFHEHESGKCSMWNAGSRRAEEIVKQWLAEEQVHAGLAELCEVAP